MKQIVFANMGKPSNCAYINPLFLQVHASIVQQTLPNWSIRIVDCAAGDDLVNEINVLSGFDTLVIGLDDESALDEFMALISSHESRELPGIVVSGLLLSAGLPSEVLQRVQEAIPGARLTAFVGRETSELLDAIDIVNGGFIEAGVTPQAVGRPRIDLEKALPGNATSAESLPFSTNMRHRISEEGLVVLLECLTRGCGHRCLYCHLNNTRRTSGVVQNIVSDPVSLLRSVERLFGASCLYYFADENFFGGDSAHLDRIIEFAQRLKDSGFSGRIGVDSRIDTIYSTSEDEETRSKRMAAWSAMIAAGLSYCYFGIESFSPSQLKRYGKLSELPSITAGILAAKRLGIDFTVGLIVMDPMVDTGEINETVTRIEQLDIAANTASLLKPMRLQSKGKFIKVLQRKSQTPIASPGLLDSPMQKAFFEAPDVNASWPFLSAVHSIFLLSGYRHSDVAAHLTLLKDLELPDRCFISERVVAMEKDVIQLVFGDRLSPEIDLEGEIMNLVCGCSQDCQVWLRKLAKPKVLPLSAKKFVRHYSGVFDRILDRVSSFPAFNS